MIPSTPTRSRHLTARGIQATGRATVRRVSPATRLRLSRWGVQSNASTVRTLSFLSFLFGGLMLSGAMWIWSDKLIEEARLAGVPMPLMNELASARSAAKMCSIIHLVVLGVALVVLIVIVAVWGFLLASISS